MKKPDFLHLVAGGERWGWRWRDVGVQVEGDMGGGAPGVLAVLELEPHIGPGLAPHHVIHLAGLTDIHHLGQGRCRCRQW